MRYTAYVVHVHLWSMLGNIGGKVNDLSSLSHLRSAGCTESPRIRTWPGRYQRKDIRRAGDVRVHGEPWCIVAFDVQQRSSGPEMHHDGAMEKTRELHAPTHVMAGGMATTLGAVHLAAGQDRPAGWQVGSGRDKAMLARDRREGAAGDSSRSKAGIGLVVEGLLKQFWRPCARQQSTEPPPWTSLPNTQPASPACDTRLLILRRAPLLTFSSDFLSKTLPSNGIAFRNRRRQRLSPHPPASHPHSLNKQHGLRTSLALTRGSGFHIASADASRKSEQKSHASWSIRPPRCFLQRHETAAHPGPAKQQCSASETAGLCISHPTDRLRPFHFT